MQIDRAQYRRLQTGLRFVIGPTVLKNDSPHVNLFQKPETKSYEIQGQSLRCVICQHDEFDRRDAQLHTALATFFNLEWANRSALCLVCERCGYIHWFLPK